MYTVSHSTSKVVFQDLRSKNNSQKRIMYNQSFRDILWSNVLQIPPRKIIHTEHNSAAAIHILLQSFYGMRCTHSQLFCPLLSRHNKLFCNTAFSFSAQLRLHHKQLDRPELKSHRCTTLSEHKCCELRPCYKLVPFVRSAAAIRYETLLYSFSTLLTSTWPRSLNRGIGHQARKKNDFLFQWHFNYYCNQVCVHASALWPIAISFFCTSASGVSHNWSPSTNGFS